jgi:molecular chaperone DnaK (HSP70)
MIVDCGGGTVDLTTRKLNGIKPLQLGEVTERIGDFCGSTFIDRFFIDFLRERLGTRAIDLLIENHYGQLQYMVQEFCRRVKEPFTGDNTEFRYDLDIEENAPVLLQYVSGEVREIMEEDEWLIEITYNDVKNWFDPIIKRIIDMIHIQLSNTLNNGETCSAMFLVGGFSESKYLQKRIKQEFQNEVKIIPPNQPIAAIVRGAAMYGLSLKNSSNAHRMNRLKQHVIHSRTLKFTYGIKILGRWKDNYHSIDRRVFDDKIYLFETFVKRGTKVEVDKEFPKFGYKPLTQSQKALKFELYKTPKYNATYHDENEMELVGILRILLPTGFNSAITFGFSFGQMEITAFAKNELNGQNFHTKFDVNDL